LGNPIPKNEVFNEQSSRPEDERLSQVFFTDNTTLQRAEKAESELELLRSDYLSRIAGMVKAIAAVERSNDKAAEAVPYLENLNKLSAGELIEEYRRTSARFRSAFPTTFGLGPLISNKARGVKNPGDFK
jgi:hypothetical protein